MPHRDPPARLAPIRDDEFTDETRAFFGQWVGGIFQNADRHPVLRTFAHNPALANAFSVLNVHVLSANSLPVKERQIAIMRTTWLTKATFMWSSHLNTSLRCGLSDEMYGPIQRGADDPYFSDFERAVVRGTDELVRDHTLSDATWQALRAEWDNKQMLDFLFTVGLYVLLAGAINATGAERPDDLLELAEKYGAP